MLYVLIRLSLRVFCLHETSPYFHFRFSFRIFRQFSLLLLLLLLLLVVVVVVVLYVDYNYDYCYGPRLRSRYSDWLRAGLLTGRGSRPGIQEFSHLHSAHAGSGADLVSYPTASGGGAVSPGG
jgi:hypothetical protein